MMNSVVLMNLAILLMLIPVGIFTAWSVLRGLDKLSKIKFKNYVLPTISKNPMALSIYFSVRFAAVMYLVATLTSRFI